MDLDDFKLSDQQVQEGIDLHDVQHLVSLPQFSSAAVDHQSQENSRISAFADSVASEMQPVDYKLLEREIEHFLAIGSNSPQTDALSGRYVKPNRAVLGNPDQRLLLQQRILDNQTTMKVLYDECPTEFQFGMKQARLLVQATLLNLGPSMGAYSPYVSTAMQVALRENKGQFKVDEYTFFDHVYFMTVNLSKLTSQSLSDLVRFVTEVSTVCNWADPHLGVSCYQTYKVMEDGSQRRIFGSNLAVVGIFARDFQRFLVAQLYERRHLRMHASSVRDYSNCKIAQLFEARLLSQDPQRPSRHTELTQVVGIQQQLGLNLNSFDRQLTNEISLLKLSICKTLGMPVSARVDSISFDKLKQAGASWQEYLIQTVSDCNIIKYTIHDADEDDLHPTFVNTICNVFSTVQVYWPLNQTLILIQSRKEERGSHFIFDIYLVTIGPFDQEQQQANESAENVLYAEVAAQQRAFTEMERLARYKRDLALKRQKQSLAVQSPSLDTRAQQQKPNKMQSQRLRIRQLNEKIVEDFLEMDSLAARQKHSLQGQIGRFIENAFEDDQI